MSKRLGIIQSRGLGDLVIALPIAHFYHRQGWEIYWPISEEFMPSMTGAAPWVKWIPVKTDQGPFFFDVPFERLKNFKCDEIICLYQALTGHPEFTERPEWQITGFDQIKYSIAQVPFLEKWRLSDCILRNAEREQALKDRLGLTGQPYVVVHTEGSNHHAYVDPDWVPDGWDQVKISPLTDNIWDWLGVIEGSEAVITVDSVYANIVDQMKWTEKIDCYFIPRSHIQLTPVLGGNWTYLDPGPDVLNKIRVFR